MAETGTTRIKSIIIELKTTVDLVNQYYVELSGEKQKIDMARLHLGDALNSMEKSVQLLQEVVIEP